MQELAIRLPCHDEARRIENKITGGKEALQYFRELVKPKWSEAFFDAVETVAGTREFTYVTAVTAIVGDRKDWEQHPDFVKAMRGNPIRMIDLTEMINHIKKNSTPTVASSAIGRVIQLMAAAEKSKRVLVKVIEIAS